MAGVFFHLLRLVPLPWTFQLSGHVILRKLHHHCGPGFALGAKTSCEDYWEPEIVWLTSLVYYY